SQVFGFGMDYLALAMVVSNTAATPRWLRWIRLILAGLAVGVGVIDGADNGAIFSLFVAAYVFFHSLMEEGATGMKVARGIGRVTMVAIFAGLIAMQTVVGIFHTQIQGISGMDQNKESTAEHWDWATQWSVPKTETLSFVIAGLYGYRMNTPADMPEWLQSHYEGGQYWGKMGRDIAWYHYFEDNGPAPDPNRQFLRFTGGGNYMGVLVALISLWTIVQSFRKRDSVFSIYQKKFIWFWAGAIGIAFLLALGRFAPFYQFFYRLPYFSTMRNPCKFTAVMSWALVVVFAYGIDALWRRYAYVAANAVKKDGFDRKWLIGCFVAIGVSLVGWLLYLNNQPQLVAYLKQVGFGDDLTANGMAACSIAQVGWFVLFLVLDVAVLAFVFRGAFAGKRAHWMGICLGTVLLVDMVHSNLPYIVYWNYKEKYAVNFPNPIIDRLRDKPYEQRVFALPFSTVPQMDLFSSVYRIEWAQQLFPYYDILTMDIVQMPRAPVDFEAFEDAVRPHENNDMYKMSRRWELTSTRYLVGPMITSLGDQNYLTLRFLNEGLDPGKGRFRIVTQFELVPKPNIQNPSLEQLTTTEHPDPDQSRPPLLPEFPQGRYALFEFTGALPRANIYNQWQVNTNGPDTLKTIASETFDPHTQVVVAKPLGISPSTGSTNQSPGEVKITQYKAADIMLEANARENSVVMLTDRYDPEWKVFVDGKQEELLQCDFIMRGVAVPPGKHKVEFLFRPSFKPALVTLAAMALGILLSCVMIYSERRGIGKVKEVIMNDVPVRNNKNPKNPRS
ncbi:MAG TPA: YfhO family protein, partial [Verrucomicrobiae bacterium]|nr:YfhO family protein [Verrucomicrobiae bacterium]